jgi:hypothetical protein
VDGENEEERGFLTVDFSSHELRHIAARVGGTLLTALQLDAGSDSENADSAHINLTKRSVLSPQGALVEPIEALFRVFSEAGLIARARIVAPGGSALSCQIVATPEVAVLHQLLDVDLHRFVPFAVNEVPSMLLKQLGLPPAASGTDTEIRVPSDAYVRSVAAAHQQDEGLAVRLLVREGVSSELAEEFVAAYGIRRAHSALAIVYSTSLGAIGGGELDWLEIETGDIWLAPLLDAPLLDPADDLDADGALVVLARVDSDELSSAILGLLPPHGD